MDRIHGEVRRELDRFGAQGNMAEVVAAWPAAVGETIARNAWPARVARDGTLHVAVSSSAWAFELAQLEATVLAQLRDGLGAVAPPRLKFAPGPLPEPQHSTRESASPPPRPTVEQQAEAARLAASIDDENLRELVARAAAASLARATVRRSF